jgi:hypothetical protein
VPEIDELELEAAGPGGLDAIDQDVGRGWEGGYFWHKEESVLF